MLSDHNRVTFTNATGHGIHTLTSKQVVSHHMDKAMNAARAEGEEAGVVKAEHAAAETITKLERMLISALSLLPDDTVVGELRRYYDQMIAREQRRHAHEVRLTRERDEALDRARAAESGVVASGDSIIADLAARRDRNLSGISKIHVLFTEHGDVVIPPIGVLLDEMDPADRAKIETMLAAFREFSQNSEPPTTMPIMESPATWTVDISDKDIAEFWPGENPADIRLQLANAMASVMPQPTPAPEPEPELTAESIRRRAIQLASKAEAVADGQCGPAGVRQLAHVVQGLAFALGAWVAREK